MDTTTNPMPQDMNVNEPRTAEEQVKKDRQGLKTAGVAAAAALGTVATMKAAEGIANLHGEEEEALLEPDGMVGDDDVQLAEAVGITRLTGSAHRPRVHEHSGERHDEAAPADSETPTGEEEETVNVDDVTIADDTHGEEVVAVVEGPIEPDAVTVDAEAPVIAEADLDAADIISTAEPIDIDPTEIV